MVNSRLFFDITNGRQRVAIPKYPHHHRKPYLFLDLFDSRSRTVLFDKKFHFLPHGTLRAEIISRLDPNHYIRDLENSRPRIAVVAPIAWWIAYNRKRTSILRHAALQIVGTSL
jgi:hypothetical protein